MISRYCALLTLGLATVVPSMFATTYSGSDKGCFGLAGSCSTVSGTMSYGLSNHDLTFTTAAINQVGNGSVKLGTFSLGTNPSLFAGTFDLDVKFSAPAGVTGTGDFDAVLAGAVGFHDDGVAFVAFTNPTTQSFSYPGGSFSLSLDNPLITLCDNNSMDLTGTITGTSAAPEPMSMLLLGSGLGLLGLARFRRTAKQ